MERLRRVRRIAACGLLIIFGACGASDGVDPRPTHSVIAYSRYFGANTFDIVLVDADSGGSRRITTDGYADWPRWSADGRRIAFSSRSELDPVVGYTRQIFVMNADGTGVRQLTHELMGAESPSWSPDGREVVFVCGPEREKPWRLCFMGPDGGNERFLSIEGERPDSPAWSPDGRRIAFLCSRSTDDAQRICTIRPDGTGFAQITPDTLYAYSLAWSRDASRLAIAAAVGRCCTFQLFVMTLDDGTLRPVLTGENALSNARHSPTWSPDGRRLAFIKGEFSGSFSIQRLYVVDIDGTNERPVPTGKAGSLDLNPSWSPLLR